MTQPMKARLLGAGVLVSLAIIFLPWVFDGTGVKEREAMDMTIPEPPVMPEVVLQEPSRELLDKPIEPEAELVQPEPEVAVVQPKPAVEADPPKPLSLTVEKPALDAAGVPVAWTLQLASFKDQTNAANLRSKLLKKGYKAYIREKDGLQKVFVGPDIQRTEIEKLRDQLKQEFKLDGLILRFSTH